MAANLVTFCCSTESPLGELNAYSLSPQIWLARNLVADLWAACVWKCGGYVQPSVRWPRAEEEGRKVLREMGLWKSSKIRWSMT